MSDAVPVPVAKVAAQASGADRRVFADGTPRRLHPLTLLLSVIAVGPRSLNFLPGLLALGVTGNWQWVVPALALFILVSLVGSVLGWLRFSWRVDADDIAITSGVLSRNSRTIPFDRIQDVTIEQGLLQRALGIATVGFETGSGGGAKVDGALNAVALSEAEALRDHIRSHRTAGAVPVPVAGFAADTGGTVAAAAPAIPVGELLYQMTTGRIIIAGIFNFSLAIFAVIFAALQQADNIPGLGWFDPFDVDFWTDGARKVGLDSWVVAHQWLTIVGGVIIVLALGIATGIIRMAMTNWNFRLERGERGFRRTRGLTTRTDVVIPIARVQAAMLVTGAIRSAFGWFELKLQSLGADSKEEADHQIAPLARLDEVDHLLRQVGLDRAGYEDGSAVQTDWHRSHPVMIWVTPAVLVIIAAVMLAALVQRGGDIYWIAALPAASALFMAVIGWFDWRHRRWHFDGAVLHIADGFLRRRHIILPARNIQSADIEIGPITRRFALASLRLGVPGGRAGQHHISAIPVAAARALRSALLARR